MKEYNKHYQYYNFLIQNKIKNKKILSYDNDFFNTGISLYPNKSEILTKRTKY